MSQVFLKIVNMSISALWLIPAVLILRLLLKKAPRWITLLLWAMVAFQLLCPFSLESRFSLIPSAETISPNIMLDGTPSVQTGIPAVNDALNPLVQKAFTPDPFAGANPLQIWIPVFSALWLAGMAVMLLYTCLSCWRLHRKVSTAVLLRDNVFQSEHVPSPFVLGILKPKIYLPFSLTGTEQSYVIAHEQAHLRRRDHWWKALGFLLLSVHWFNPLVWLSYVLFCRDVELACDEKVIEYLGDEQKADYAQALLTCSVHRPGVTALAFGEVGVKERVKSVLHYKNPSCWAVIAGVMVCVAAAVFFLTDPPGPEDSFQLTEAGNSIYGPYYTYSLRFGPETTGAYLYIEQWENGACTSTDPIFLPSDCEQVRIAMDVFQQKDLIPAGTNIQIGVGKAAASSVTYLPFPEGRHYVTWGCCGYQPNERISIQPGMEKILTAMVFDSGKGIRVFDPESLVQEPERLNDVGYAILIRAVFR